MKTIIHSSITMAACVIALSGRLSADLVNGGFEAGLSGWFSSGHMSVESAPPYLPTEGTKLLAFNSANSSPNGFLSTEIVFTQGHRYRLEFDAGNLSYNSQHQRLRVQVGVNPSPTSPFGIDDIIDIPGPGGGATAWVPASYEFDVGVGGQASIIFTDISQATNAVDLLLDHVRLNDITPLTAPLVNGGFESGLAGWTVLGNVTSQSGSPYAPTEGTKLAAFNTANSAPNGSLSQELAVPSGQLYRINFDVGNLAYNSLHQRLRVQVSYRIFGIFYPLVDDTIDITGAGGGATTWLAKGYDFTSPNGLVIVTFTDVSPATNSLDLVLDRVRLTPVVKLDISASSPGGAIAASIPITPEDIDAHSGGVTPFQRRYFQGAVVTLSAPAASGGLVFQQWKKSGVNFSNTPEIAVTMTGDAALEAVYGPGSGLTLSPYEGFEITGAAGTGPFTPSSKEYVISNTGGVASLWFIANESKPGAPAADWVTCSPSSGYLLPGESVTVTFNVNLQALNLPPGTYVTFFMLHTDFGDIPIPLFNLTAAAGVLPVNGGFESGLAGWIAGGNVAARTGAPYSPTEGTTLAAFNAANSTPNGTIEQSLATVIGKRYRLQFDVGNLAYNSAHQRMQVAVTYGLSYHFSGTLVSDIIDIPGPGGGATAWVSASYDFTAPWVFVNLKFTDVSQATNGLDLVLDNVRLIQLPDPVEITVLGFENGLAGWDASGNVAVFSAAPYSPTEGSKLAGFNAANSAPNGSISLHFPVSPSQTYKIEFDAGNLAYNSQQQRIQVRVQDDFSGPPVYLVSDIVSIPAPPAAGGTTWVTPSYQFTPPHGSVIITFTDVSLTTNSLDLLLDNIRITRLAP